MLRCVFLVDGFNLYHSMEDEGQHALKWLNLHRLAQVITAPLPEHSVKVHWFSAYAEWRKEANDRHRAYVAALKSAGVSVVLGNFKRKPRSCKNCGSEWRAPEEKETDVNIALKLVRSAYEKSYDRMYLITGDTDITPAVRMAREIYPEGLITIAAPPGRDKFISALINAATNQQRISFDMLKQAQFPDEIRDAGGNIICERPDKYKQSVVKLVTSTPVDLKSIELSASKTLA